MGEKVARLAGDPQCFIHVSVRTKFDKEVGRWVAGSPELEVWSSGQTPDEAFVRSREAILAFLDDATERGTVWKVLEECGVEVHETADVSVDPFFERLKSIFQNSIFFPATFPVQSRDRAAHC
jgi:predicted RNase H-like HicB family nuclease